MQNIAQDTANSVCPVCGMPVDANAPQVIAPLTGEECDLIVRVGACGCEHHDIIAHAPERYARAALDNLVANRFEDG